MERYNELLSLYLDGEPSDAELNELAELLKVDAKLAEDFRQELLIWDAWSQEHAPERSAESFIAGFHTRLRAEADATEFELSVTKQLKERKNPFAWQPLIAIAAVLVILLSVSIFINPADVDTGLVATAEAGIVHIEGECVCTRCTMKREGRCEKAVRYTDANGEEHVIRLRRDPALREYGKHFCRHSSHVNIEGEIVEENGEKILVASAMTIGDEKVL